MFCFIRPSAKSINCSLAQHKVFTLQSLQGWVGVGPLEQSQVEYIIVIALKVCCSNPYMLVWTSMRLPSGPLSWKPVIKLSLSIGFVAAGPDFSTVENMARSSMRGSVCGWKAWWYCVTSGGELQLFEWPPFSSAAIIHPRGCEMIYWIEEK